MKRRRLALLALVSCAAVAAAALAATRVLGTSPGADAARSRRALRPPRATNLPPAPLPPHPTSRAGVELGRRLFFDPRLSGNDRISCATCHEPARAFTDGEARSTRGATGAPLARNTPGLANLAWASSLFWDGGSRNLESLALGPIQAPDEMAERVEHMIAQLAADPEVRAAADRAFPGEGVTPAVVMRALAQYMRSLVSAGSRYDRHVRGEPGGILDAAEQRGLAVYRSRCERCHATDLFTDHQFHDIGLDPPPEAPLPAEDPRRGRARVTFQAADEHAFRTPTLRNLSYTAPYMHDGRFATLGEVLDHYRFGVHRTPSLAPGLIASDGTAGLPLTEDEARDLTAFLATLDDPSFIERHRVRGSDEPPTRTDPRARDR